MESSVITNLVMPLSTAVIMLGMGLSLTLRDFHRMLETPLAVGVGLFGQIVLLPLVGFCLALAFSLPADYAIGLMILVSCAGGAASNLIVYLAKGDVALSVTLTAVSSLITIATIPLLVNFALAEFLANTDSLSLPLGSTNLKLFIITVLPMTIGMWILHRFPRQAPTLEKWISRFTYVFVTTLITMVFLQNYEIIFDHYQVIGITAFLLNVITMGLGFLLAGSVGLAVKQKMSISIEIGVQNGFMAMFIAVTLLDNQAYAIFPAFYSSIMYITVVLLTMYLKRKKGF